MTNAAKDLAKQSTEYTQDPRLLEKLLEFEPLSAPVVSLYLDARADQHGRRNLLSLILPC